MRTLTVELVSSGIERVYNHVTVEFGGYTCVAEHATMGDGSQIRGWGALLHGCAPPERAFAPTAAAGAIAARTTSSSNGAGDYGKHRKRNNRQAGKD
jgi:hypothetical protein